MADLLELTRDIVVAHLHLTPLTSDDLLQELQQLHAILGKLETGRLRNHSLSSTGSRSTTSRRRKAAAVSRQPQRTKGLSLLGKRRLRKRQELVASLDLAANLAKARAARQAEEIRFCHPPPGRFLRRAPVAPDDYLPES